jgi:hypothetical protein
VLERDLTELFDQQAGEEPPPVSASIAEAVRTGRKHGRRRRLVAVGTPLLAAVVVLAIATSAALSRPAPAPPVNRGKPWHSLHLAPPEFNPLMPYVSFGWLPDHARATAVTDGRSVEFLSAVGPHQASWQLSVFVRGDCSLRKSQLACRDLTPLQDPTAAQVAPDIDGVAAYWDFPYLVFEYAGNGWAILWLHGTGGHAVRAARATAVHIAQTLRFGQRAAPVWFPDEVTGLPPGWAIRSLQFSYGTQRLLASSYQLAAGAVLAAPWFDITDVPTVAISPAGQPPTGCPVTPGQSQQTTLDKYPVTILQTPAGHEQAEQSLCAADADGLAVSIVISGNHPPISVSQLFARIRLLGPNPAHWTTGPIG